MAVQNDGFSTQIDITGAGESFFEKSVTPPGMDGGDAIDVTTMRNSDYRTFAPRSLVTATAMTLTVAYDPDFYDDVLTLLNVNSLITVTFPDTHTVAFWGFLQKFEPNESAEGTQPEATITITPTNLNDETPQVETAPVYA